MADVEVVAVGARDLARAREAASGWGLPLAFGSYAELVACDDVDAVYVGTPAAFHRPWVIAAIEAGKHVLCEKPLAANAGDAGRIADAARASDCVVMEAYHWRYHPCASQIADIVGSGSLGRLEHLEARFDLPAGHIPKDDIRWDLALGGGALMDLGCYPIQWVRFVVGADPDVVAATAECPWPDVDGRLTAELRWASGVTGSIHCSMIEPPGGVGVELVVRGERGVLTVVNPLAPQFGARLVVETADGRTEHDVVRTSTYRHQLLAFRDAVLRGAQFPTTAEDGARTMAIIDACYRAAGLEPRPAWPDAAAAGGP